MYILREMPTYIEFWDENGIYNVVYYDNSFGGVKGGKLQTVATKKDRRQHHSKFTFGNWITTLFQSAVKWLEH